MKDIVNFQGAKSTVHKFNIKIFTVAFLAFTAFALTACDRATTGDGSKEVGAETAQLSTAKQSKWKKSNVPLKRKHRDRNRNFRPSSSRRRVFKCWTD
jgi:hypothetical protein